MREKERHEGLPAETPARTQAGLVFLEVGGSRESWSWEAAAGLDPIILAAASEDESLGVSGADSALLCALHLLASSPCFDFFHLPKLVSSNS